MAYLNILFPTRVSDGSRGGPEFKNFVLEYESGYESVDSKRTLPKHRYNIVAGTMDEDELDEVHRFFWVVGGRTNSFRFRDPWDYKTCSYASTLAATDQLLLSNLSVAVTTVQLTKTYTFGTATLTRTITKPDASTVVFSVDGSTRTTGFTVNGSTGIVIFSPALASTVASVRWGGEFWVHARFDIDWFAPAWEGGLIANTDIPLVEKLEAL